MLLAAVAGCVAALGGFAVGALAGGGAVEGSTFTYGVPITGVYSCPCQAKASFGDGTTISTGFASPTYTFDASHVYSTAGVYTYGVTITSCIAGLGCGLTQTGTTPVADAALSAGSGPPISVLEGQAFTGTLGHFTDADPTTHPASHYSVTVDWGDGTTSPGTVTAAAGGGFDVTGTHTWAAPGSFAVHAAVTDQVGAGVTASSAVLRPVATVASTAPPHAAITPFAQPVIGGQSIPLSAAGSTGSSALTYSWTFCSSSTRQVSCAPGSPTASGASVSYAFPFAPVHDPKRLGRVDPTQRRSTTLVVLTVTDALGHSDTTSTPVTILPDLPPKSSFAVGPVKLVGQDTATLTPSAFDPNHNDRIVEEDWDLTGDGAPDLICRAFAGCQTVDPALAPALKGVGLVFAARGRHARSFTPTTSSPPTAQKVGTAAELAFQNTQLALSAAAFPAVHWNFADAALAASHLAPLNTINLSTLANPTDAGRAQFLRDLAYEEFWETPLVGLGSRHRPASAINDSNLIEPDTAYPRQLSLTAIDAEGETATSTLPISVAIDRGPAARFTQIPDPGKPVPQAGDTVKLDTSQIKDPDGGVAWYVLEAAPAGPADPTDGSHYCNVEGPLTTGKVHPGVLNTYDKNTGAPIDNNPKDKKPKGLPRPSTSTDATPAPPPTVPAGLPVQVGLDGLLAGTAIERYCGHGWERAVVDPTIVQTGTSASAVDHVVLPTEGDWSVSITAYDQLGVSGRRILYPIHVDAAQTDCAPQSPQKFFDGKLSYGLSGTCFTSRGSVYVTEKSVNLDGATLSPAAGSRLVFVDRKDGTGAVFATTLALPSPLGSGSTALDSWATLAKGKIGLANLRLGDDSIGQWTLNASVVPGLLDGGLHTVPIPDNAVYKGLPIAPGTLTLQFASYGNSEVKLDTQLPTVLGGGNTQGDVDVQASNAPGQSFPATIDPIEPQKERGAHAARRRAAHAAADDTDPNTMPLDDGTDIGPIPIPSGTSFKYDAATQTWIAKIPSLSIPGLPGDASLTLTIKGATLVGATGHVSGPIEIAPGVDLSSIDFTIDTSPNVTISAATTVTVAGVVSGTGRLTLTPDPFDARVDANLKVLNFLPLGGGYVEYTNGSLSFAGNAGYDFGPASLNVGVSGGVNLGSGQFYVLGSGKACLFACLGVQAIVSSVGVAACGDIDLVLTDVQVGLGYHWDGGLSLWLDSCGLSSFKVATSRSVPVASAGATLSPGASETLTVPKGFGALALRIAGPKGAGVAPHIQLVGPSGDSRVVTNPAAIGDYSFGLDGSGTKQGTALIEENPLDATTNAIVAKPAAGKWTLRVFPDSVPVVSVQTAEPVTTTSVTKKMVSLSSGVGTGDPLVHGSRFDALHNGHATTASTATAKLHPTVHASALPTLERNRVRRLGYSVTTTDGAVVLLDQSTSGSTVLAQAAAGGTRKGTVAFDPAGGGTHTIRAITLDARGLPVGSMVVETYKAPPIPTPPAPGITKIVRRGSLAYVLLSRGPADPSPGAIAYYVRLRDSRGGAQGFVVLGRQVVHVDGHPAIVVHGVPAGSTINVHVRSAFDGNVSAASKHA